MEKNQKNEKPVWVEEIEQFPVILQQQIGNLCAGVIASMIQLYFLSKPLYDSVCVEISEQITNHFKEVEKRNNS